MTIAITEESHKYTQTKELTDELFPITACFSSSKGVFSSEIQQYKENVLGENRDRKQKFYLLCRVLQINWFFKLRLKSCFHPRPEMREGNNNTHKKECTLKLNGKLEQYSVLQQSCNQKSIV